MAGASADGAADEDWLAGAIDVHVHAAPSLYPRWGDGAAVARACGAAGMAGVLLKAHEGSTVEAAAALSAAHAPLRVFGGVVLNRYVGGINPAAADVALRLGACCVWFPTIDADDHARAYGATGRYPGQRGGREDEAVISALGADGELTPAALEVLALVRDHDACVATGHLGAAAIERVLAAAADLGVARVLVQHPCLATPGLDLDAIEAVAARGARVELTYLSVSPMWQETTLEACVEVVRRVGPDAVVLSSDAGQRHNPSPPEALRSFAQSLHERGLAAADVRRMLTEVPAALVG